MTFDQCKLKLGDARPSRTNIPLLFILDLLLLDEAFCEHFKAQILSCVSVSPQVILGHPGDVLAV